MNRLVLAVFTVGALLSTNVLALPVALPGGPVFVQFNTAEQYSASNDIGNVANPAAAGFEGNWGIVQITNLSIGTVVSPTGSRIAGPGATIFSDGQNGGEQILGMFYGVVNNPGGPPFTSIGGVLDLYYWSSNNQVINTPFSSADLVKRGQGGSQSGNTAGAYLGFTCSPGTPGCTFLARFDFTPGADVSTTSNTNTIVTPANSSTSEAYLSVDTATPGVWTGFLASNFFTLDPIDQVCGSGIACTSPNDLRLEATFTRNGAEPWDIANTDIIGLGKGGSFGAFVVPEPDSLALLAIGLTAVGVAGSRRKHPVDRLTNPAPLG